MIMNLIHFRLSVCICTFVCAVLSLVMTSPMATAQTPSLLVMPTDFDTVATGRTAIKSCLIINPTNRPVEITNIQLSAPTTPNPFSLFLQTNYGFTLAGGDTLFLPIRCTPTTTGVLNGTISIRALNSTAPVQFDTITAPLSAFSRLQRITDVAIRPAVRIIPDSAAPGDTVRLELYLANTDSRTLQALLSLSQPFFQSVVGFNANLLFPLNLPSQKGTPPSLLRYVNLNSRWDGTSSLLFTTLLLVMNGDTDRTNIRISSFLWGEAARSNVFVDEVLNGFFRLKVCTEGGKRLFRPADRINALLVSIAPNPTSDKIEIHYTLNTNEAPEFTLLDAQGRTVQRHAQGKQTEGDYTLTLDARGLASGMYRLQMQTVSGMEQRTVAIVH